MQAIDIAGQLGAQVGDAEIGKIEGVVGVESGLGGLNDEGRGGGRRFAEPECKQVGGAHRGIGHLPDPGAGNCSKGISCQGGQRHGAGGSMKRIPSF